jgi:hypothetical protein
MTDDADVEPDQFSDKTRERLEATARELADAILAQAAVAASATGHADVRAIFVSIDELDRAARAYDDAHFEHTGIFPLGLPDVDDEDEEDEDEDELLTGEGLTVIRRTDFILHDPDALIEAGRAAYLEVWPDDARRDAEADVEDVGRAIYQISHAHGLDALLEAEGLAPTAGITVIHTQEHPLEAEGLDEAIDSLDTNGPWTIYATEGTVLTSSSDLW